LSATAESEPDILKMQTPAKRSGDKTFAAEPTSAKLSSNKIKLKPVKKEKMTGHQLNI
jgi:hypothetical protein